MPGADLEIFGGTLNAAGGTAAGMVKESFGLDVDDLTISGGEVTATGSDAAIATYVDEDDANSVVIDPEDGLAIAVEAGASRGRYRRC